MKRYMYVYFMKTFFFVLTSNQFEYGSQRRLKIDLYLLVQCKVFKRMGVTKLDLY